MPILTQAEYVIGDLCVRYQAPEDRPAAWGLALLPAKLAAQAVAPREWLDASAVTALPAPWNRMRAWEVDPLVHVHLAGDAYPGGFASGRTLRNSATTAGLAVQAHTREDRGGVVILRTRLAGPGGLECAHELTVDPAAGVATVQVTARNAGQRPIALEHLGAFSLGGLTPFAADDAAGRLWVHRFRSAWSAEGRLETRSVEASNLERSWTGHGVRTERFGQTGSLPVNGWFPLVGLEDRAAGVTWLAQLATPGSWHLEIYRRADQLALAGGGPDRLAGEWRHTLHPGESVTAPAAFLTCVAGNLDDACDRLVSAGRNRAEGWSALTPARLAPPASPTSAPGPVRSTSDASKEALPVIFNEWCTSWGKPTHDSIVALADRLKGSGVRYLVIDDGWAERPGDAFQQNGDWKVNRRAFPAGLKATTEAIRARGLVPGIWFEFESVNPGSAAWHETSHQLHRDGVVLQVGNRRFWDFRDPWVHAYLAERVIGRLREDGFGYLKVDNNDSIGPGVDGPASPGENLRRHLAGVQEFFGRLRAELPELVIENCSSGGHRLEASMMALTAMSSFSDAHETPDIPLIAADLNRLVWSGQKQIWAVLHAADSPQRLAYTLAATFLGRMCLSGDVAMLGAESWALVREAVACYHEVAPVIRDGVFRMTRSAGDSWQHPTGHQVVTIHDASRRRLLVVWHTFAGAGLDPAVNLPAGSWRLVRQFSSHAVTCTGSSLRLGKAPDWSGGVVLLEA